MEASGQALMKRMQSNQFIARLKEYPLASHKAWDHKNKRKVLKLDWNESDIRLPLRIRLAVARFALFGQTHWYPDIANRKLIEGIAKYVGVPNECVQYFGGEDSALDYVVRTFVMPGDSVGLVAPTYDNFRVYVESVGANPVSILSEDVFTKSIQDLRRQIAPDMKMVYLVNPNNPTGVTWGVNEIEALLQEFPNTLFMIDEAYGEFGSDSAAQLVSKYGNIVVGRSFSKAFGLASYRMGYVISSPENIGHINKIRNGKGIAALAQVAALEALRNPEYMRHYVEEVSAARSLLAQRLGETGFEVKNTPANFVLFKVSDPAAFCAKLQERGVFIRGLGHLPRMEQYVRVTVGTRRSAERFVDAVCEVVADGSFIPK